MNILVAATGGVAALKTPSLIRRLQEAGHAVRVAATEAAYQFVTPLSLAVAAGSPVFDQAAWFAPDGEARHIALARWAELLLVAPATADALASAATGRADDVVSALCLTGIPRIVWTPAMNTAMWQHPAVQHNCSVLRGFGHQIIEPDTGRLATKGEGEGIGRMPEPEALVQAVLGLPQDFQGKTLLISAGPTQEYLDPVRFISNPSSGKMGYALAEAALSRGAKVVLVSGPTALTPPQGAMLIAVTSAQEMLETLSTHFAQCDALIMSAAVADWRAETIKAQKEPKQGEVQTLKLVRTPDILSTLNERRNHQKLVGFAMETDAGVERAADKARRKGLEFICLNYPTKEGSAFGGDENEVTIVSPDGAAEPLPRLSKRALADEILSRLLNRL
jgi:phosphopantothenoylcysteine decarboxylase/phosphopantothenate--cysteine ligase